MDCSASVRHCWGEEIIAGGGQERALLEDVLTQGPESPAGTNLSQSVEVEVGRASTRLFPDEGPQGHRSDAAEAVGESGGGVDWEERSGGLRSVRSIHALGDFNRYD